MRSYIFCFLLLVEMWVQKYVFQQYEKQQHKHENGFRGWSPSAHPITASFLFARRNHLPMWDLLLCKLAQFFEHYQG